MPLRAHTKVLKVGELERGSIAGEYSVGCLHAAVARGDGVWPPAEHGKLCAPVAAGAGPFEAGMGCTGGRAVARHGRYVGGR